MKVSLGASNSSHLPIAFNKERAGPESLDRELGPAKKSQYYFVFGIMICLVSVYLWHMIMVFQLRLCYKVSSENALV